MDLLYCTGLLLGCGALHQQEIQVSNQKQLCRVFRRQSAEPLIPAGVFMSLQQIDCIEDYMLFLDTELVW